MAKPCAAGRQYRFARSPGNLPPAGANHHRADCGRIGPAPTGTAWGERVRGLAKDGTDAPGSDHDSQGGIAAGPAVPLYPATAAGVQRLILQQPQYALRRVVRVGGHRRAALREHDVLRKPRGLLRCIQITDAGQRGKTGLAFRFQRCPGHGKPFAGDRRFAPARPRLVKQTSFFVRRSWFVVRGVVRGSWFLVFR